MDNQFNTLIQSYHDNFLQYKITGGTSYQNSYQSAQEGIEKIIQSMQSEVDSQKKQIGDIALSEEKLRDLASEERNSQKRLIKERDQYIAAKMRSTQLIPETYSVNPKYITVGVLGLILLVLNRLTKKQS